MKPLTALLTFSLLTYPLPVSAQPIEPHFLPEGEIISLQGEEHIAYDFEQFRQLLELDEELFHAQEQLSLVEEQLDLRVQELDLMQRRLDTLSIAFTEVQDAYQSQQDDLTSALSTAEELRFLLEQSESEPRRTFWHPTHLLIEGALLLTATLSLYLWLSD